jgi:hypothetical protein
MRTSNPSGIGHVLVNVGDLHAVAQQSDGVVDALLRLDHRGQTRPHRVSDADDGQLHRRQAVGHAAVGTLGADLPRDFGVTGG